MMKDFSVDVVFNGCKWVKSIILTTKYRAPLNIIDFLHKRRQKKQFMVSHPFVEQI